MANVLSALQPILFSAARVVPRELTGILGAVDRDFTDQGVAKGDSVKVSVAPTLTAQNVTPGQVFTVGNDRTPTAVTLTLNQEQEVTWNLKPEEERSLMNAGVAQDMLAQTIQQGIRTLVNKVELYTYGIARAAASRAYGTPGTTPFGTAADLTDISNVLKILLDNGCSVDDDKSLVIDTFAGLNLRGKQAGLFRVNEAGTSDLLRQGVLGDLQSFKIRESAQVGPIAKGTGTLYTTTAAGFAIGATSIPLITGSGTILAGDVVTFAGDTNKYVVTTGIAAPGTIVIQEPGLRVAIAAAATALTVGNIATANIALRRNAIKAVIRPSLQPVGAIAEQMTVSDPQTGLTFLLLRVPGNAITSWYMRIVYDAFAPNPYAIAQLLG